MAGPVTLQQLPGMTGVQHSRRITTGRVPRQRGTSCVRDGYVGVRSDSDHVRTSFATDLAMTFKQDLQGLRKRGPDAVLHRAHLDMERLQARHASDVLDYVFGIINYNYGNRDRIPLMHYLITACDDAIDTICDGQMFKTRRNGIHDRLYNRLEYYFSIMRDLEAHHAGTLSPKELELMLDCMFVCTKRGADMFCAISYWHREELPEQSYRDTCFVIYCAREFAHRYKRLGLYEKEVATQAFLHEVHTRSGVEDADFRKLFYQGIQMGLYRDWGGWVQTIIDDNNILPTMSCAVTRMPYHIKYWYFTTVADRLHDTPGGKPHEQSYRDEADEARRIGTALGLIEA